MKEIKAIGFDLFNTLITVAPPALKEALGRLVHSLKQSGFILEEELFRASHREAAHQAVVRAIRHSCLKLRPPLLSLRRASCL